VAAPEGGVMEHEVALAAAANDNGLAGQRKFTPQIGTINNYQFDHPCSYE
jgi:hypothetical protein